MSVSGSHEDGAGEAVAQRSATDFLHGRWQVRRRIVDHLRGIEGDFVGSAEFTDGLFYREEGELRFGEHRGPSTRSLQYVDRGAHVLDVQFADGRDFYRLNLCDGRWSAEHLCQADAYVVTGQITGPDSFTERWYAAGPAKDYELWTRYERDGKGETATGRAAN